MITFSYRQNKKSETKSVVRIDHEVADLADVFDAEIVNGWTEYGFAVEMQALARSGKLEDTLKHRDISYTIEHDVPVKKAVTKDDVIADFLGIPVEMVTSELRAKVQELLKK